MPIKYQLFPRSQKISNELKKVVGVFTKNQKEICKKKGNHLKSDVVLKILADDLKALGFKVEGGKKRVNKITVPVLFGLNGSIDKSFDVDAYHNETKTIIEIEAGRGVANNQFLKDLFEACVIPDIDVLVIAVLNEYTTRRSTTKDFDTVVRFFETMYVSDRMSLPLQSILVIGY